MVFCGQCGFQLTPGATQCPRCGTKVEEPVMEPGDLTAPDAPTIASPSLLGRSPAQPTPQPLTGEQTQGATPNDPQKLVLPPVSNQNTYGVGNESTRTAYANPSRVNTPNYNTQNPTAGTSYPRHSQSGEDYPTRNAYPDYGTQAGYQGYNTQVQGGYQEPAASSSRGRVVGLVLILLGLLFILGAVILFMLQRNHVISDNNSGSTAAITAPGASNTGGNPANVTTGNGNGNANPGSATGGNPASVDKAQAVVQQYYTAINRKEYRVAYGLRQNNPQSFAEFSSGFRNTVSDKLTFGTTTVQQDGTVQVAVTVDATERTNGKLQHKTYTGYYKVGQQSGGAWKILDAALQQQ